jgi:Ni/Co efflux regulator RcnB
MKTTIYCVVASTCLLASTLAHATCSASFNEQLARTERIVDSLKPDKPGQVRVSAFDGSEFTAGEARWMKGQLRSVLEACQGGDETSATSTLQGVTELLHSHHRAP